MKQLSEMSVGQRVIITFAVLFAALLALALIGYLTGVWDAPT